MNNKKIWLAVVGVTPLTGNEILPDVRGAYVNVACMCDDEKEFKEILNQVFFHHRFKVIEIDDIETEDGIVIHNPKNAEKITLIKEIKEGYQFSWGTFHAFD
jgi:hypothetical protein